MCHIVSPAQVAGLLIYCGTSSPPGGEITVDGIRDSRVFRDGEK